MLKRTLFAGIILFLTGCAAVDPFIRDINIISVPQEKQIGAQMSAQVSQQMKLVEDSRTQRVRAIGKQLVQSLPRKDFDYHFDVVNDKTPNAFTIPGGHIYVHTGLIDFADNENEISGVIAHEIGHAYERHPAKSLTLQYGADALEKMIFKNDTASFRSLALKWASQTVLLKYGREDEYEADEVGYYILKRAGIPTSGLITFFEKLQKLGTGASIPFLSTHPPTPDRIARLKALESGQIVPRAEYGDIVVSPSAGTAGLAVLPAASSNVASRQFTASSPSYVQTSSSPQPRRYRRRYVSPQDGT